MREPIVDNAIIVLECSRPYATSGCGASDEEIDEAILMGAEALERTQWIPISEGLPEEDGCYLVTTTFDFYEGENVVVIYKFVNDDWSKEYWNKFVKAWMPLPEPYKEEQIK